MPLQRLNAVLHSTAELGHDVYATIKTCTHANNATTHKAETDAA